MTLLVEDEARTVRCAVPGCTHNAAGTQAGPDGPPRPLCSSHFLLTEPYPS